MLYFVQLARTVRVFFVPPNKEEEATKSRCKGLQLVIFQRWKKEINNFDPSSLATICCQIYIVVFAFKRRWDTSCYVKVVKVEDRRFHLRVKGDRNSVMPFEKTVRSLK